VVPGAVLTVEDLPGYEGIGASLYEEQAELSAECDIFEAAVSFPGAVATARSETLEGPLAEQVMSYAAVYASEEEASADVGATSAILERCQGEFEDAVETIARNELERLGVDIGIFGAIDISTGEYEPPEAGDETLGYRMNVTADLVITRQEYNLDVIVLREGRVAGAVLNGQFGAVSAEEEAALLETAAAKLAAADEELPD
jgi:hypothetical protein